MRSEELRMTGPTRVVRLLCSQANLTWNIREISGAARGAGGGARARRHQREMPLSQQSAASFFPASLNSGWGLS
jgi:hypothetical protein